MYRMLNGMTIFTATVISSAGKTFPDTLMISTAVHKTIKLTVISVGISFSTVSTREM